MTDEGGDIGPRGPIEGALKVAKYEYKLVPSTAGAEERLSQLGRDGWRLVHLIPAEDERAGQLIMEREVAGTSTDDDPGIPTMHSGVDPF